MSGEPKRPVYGSVTRGIQAEPERRRVVTTGPRLSPEAIERLAVALGAAQEQSGDPAAEYRAVRRLARELGMPRRSTPMHAPPQIRDGWHVEMFGELVTDGPPWDGPASWPLYQAGPGPISAARLDEIWGDSLPADERARMIAGRPALTFRAWQIVVRRDDIAPFIEARRDRRGRWEVAIRGLGSNPTAEHVREILPGLTRIRRQITRSGGRPPGRRKRSDDEIRTAVAKYQRSTGITDTPPPAKWLVGELGVSQGTAEGYLRRVKIGK